uniref:Ectonucleotide pyrophosphatase/phosphodiesterase family member 6 n=1 Tax=Panagrolaimus sp. PS1159 TaxID=55785 RepID=A0AC35FH19_9BILA
MISRGAIYFLLCFVFHFTFGESGNNNNAKGQNLILLLIDGYSAELFNRTNAAIKVGAETLLSNGVHAEYLQPVFPTQSYPNWYSLATGLYVENHNFTSDYMYNENLDIYFERDEGVNDTHHSWWDGLPDPLWYTVGKASIDVHCYWFATCHRAHRDLVVQVPKARRHNFKDADNLDIFPHLPRMMKHIKKYQPYRQQLVLLRYNGVANALRMFGEENDAINEALSNADVLIRKIQEEMDSNELFETTNLMVISDHGLMDIYEDEKFYIEDCLSDLAKVKHVVNSMSLMMIYPEEGEEDTVFFELKVCDQWAPMGDYEGDEVPLVGIHRKREIPEQYHWKNARNIAPIVVIPRPGAVILTRHIKTNEVTEANAKDYRMLSGWDNNYPEMHGIFMARGPAFKVDHTIPPLKIVDVYQIVMNVLGVEPGHKHNGTWSDVENMLSDGWESRVEDSSAFSQNTQNWPIFSSLLLSIIILRYL